MIFSPLNCSSLIKGPPPFPPVLLDFARLKLYILLIFFHPMPSIYVPLLFPCIFQFRVLLFFPRILPGASPACLPQLMLSLVKWPIITTQPTHAHPAKSVATTLKYGTITQWIGLLTPLYDFIIRSFPSFLSATPLLLKKESVCVCEDIFIG